MSDAHWADKDRVIEILASVRDRVPMYFQPVDAVTAESFLNGFVVACGALGFDVSLSVREQVTVERGWPWYAARPVVEMREVGLDERAIVDELIAIELAAWERWRDAPT